MSDARPALIRKAFADFEARSVEGLAAFLHPDVVSRVVSPLLNVGVWHGPAGFVEMNRSWAEAFGGIHYEITEIELIGERNALVGVHQEGIGAGSGVPVESDVCFLIEFEGDRAIRFEVHASRESAAAAI